MSVGQVKKPARVRGRPGRLLPQAQLSTAKPHGLFPVGTERPRSEQHIRQPTSQDVVLGDQVAPTFHPPKRRLSLGDKAGHLQPGGQQNHMACPGQSSALWRDPEALVWVTYRAGSQQDWHSGRCVPSGPPRKYEASQAPSCEACTCPPHPCPLREWFLISPGENHLAKLDIANYGPNTMAFLGVPTL